MSDRAIIVVTVGAILLTIAGFVALALHIS
jgi:hypothetical protein